MQISQKIIDYAIWYYLRYYPSKNFLSKKLREKFGPDSEKGKKYGGINDEEIAYIVGEKMKNIVTEREVCSAKIRGLIGKSKNKNYIRNNLRKKMFDMEMIDDILLNDFDSDSQSILDEEKVRKKILLLKQKHKSKRYCYTKFVESDLDKELVQKIVDEVYVEGEGDCIRYEFDKLSHLEKQKIVEKLLRKGFNYHDILETF